MKKGIFASAILTSLILSSVLSFAQKKTQLNEGKVVYEITYQDLPPEAAPYASMLASESTVYFKDTRSRTEMQQMGSSQATISDAKAKTTCTLIEAMGNKYCIKMKQEDMDKEKQGKPEVKILEETKEIAGYKCKKAEIKQKDKEGKEIVMIVWFTKDITTKSGKGNGNQNFSEIDGFVMEYQVKQQGITMVFTVKSVTEEKVDDAKFTVPADYKETTLEELKKTFGGNGN